MINLYNEKKDCCGCSACMNICPKQAIKMKDDTNGYIFPEINNDLCIECGLCKKACAFQNVPVKRNEPLATYAAINRNKDLLSSSASGGIFAALCSIIFEKQGVVFGCSYDNNMEAEHICINSPCDLNLLQGSKYVQSNVKNSYSGAKRYLEEGKWVLFTGTPCQIDGLKSFLGKDYDNLITADIICHGVPSADFFKGYTQFLENKLSGKIIDIKFRDKSVGWGHVEKVIYNKNRIIKEKTVHPFNSYYHTYFLKGYIFRECCYECKYSGGNQQGDFTMGDYWGIEEAHPEIDTKNGVSVLMVNSKKGLKLMQQLTRFLELKESTFEKARKKNSQLNSPMPKSDKREVILKTWQDGGYKAVAKEYYKTNKRQIWMSNIKVSIPRPIKNFIKRTLKSKM